MDGIGGIGGISGTGTVAGGFTSLPETSSSHSSAPSSSPSLSSARMPSSTTLSPPSSLTDPTPSPPPSSVTRLSSQGLALSASSSMEQHPSMDHPVNPLHPTDSTDFLYAASSAKGFSSLPTDPSPLGSDVLMSLFLLMLIQQHRQHL